MGLDAWLAVSIVLSSLGILWFTRKPPELIFGGGLLLMLATGVLNVEQTFAGLANPALITVAALFVVAAGIKETGAINTACRTLLGHPTSIHMAQLRMMVPVSTLSAFLNNTPVVATFIPVVKSWAQNHNIAASKVMLPLSFAAILGGLCTAIGSSTNVLIMGLLAKDLGEEIGFFTVGLVGFPCLLIGLIYLVSCSRFILRDRDSSAQLLLNPKEYTVELLVEANAGLIGKSVEEAGLRHLSGLYLIEVERNHVLHTSVGPDFTLLSGDRLIFTGVPDSIAELRNMDGLQLASDQVFKIDGHRQQRRLIEAVVSAQNPLVGKSIREGRFRNHYNAAIIAVVRNGKRVDKKIGDIVLKEADTLLLEGHQGFVQQHRASREFLLVSEVSGSHPIESKKGWLAMSLLLLMVMAATLGWLTMTEASLFAAFGMVATGCCTLRRAADSLNLQVLFLIVAALGFGEALQSSGAASFFAQQSLAIAEGKPLLLLAIVFFSTLLLTELVTNNAAAVIMYAITQGVVSSYGYHLLPFGIAIMIAASSSFLTPMGYQTNLMVYAAGGYRYADYLRLGLPLTLIVSLMSLILIPFIWPLG